MTNKITKRAKKTKTRDKFPKNVQKQQKLPKIKNIDINIEIDIEIENPPAPSNGSSEEERDAAKKSEEGAFLGTMLSAGIAFGSVVSVLVCGMFTAGGYL